MKINLTKILTAFIIFSVFSCVKKDVSMGDLTTSPFFDYTTSKNYNLQISAISPKGEAMQGAVIIITSFLPIEGKLKDTLAKGAIDEFGKCDISFQTYTYQKQLYAISTFTGINYITPIILNNTKNIFLDLYPKKYISSNRLTSNVINQSNGFKVLGSWDGNGVPNYLTNSDDTITGRFMNKINVILPESKHIPSYLIAPQTNLYITGDSADVYVTFVSEGASYKNALGFYSYDVNNPPLNSNDTLKMLNKKTLIFPNSSYSDGNVLGSGGMIPGNKVKIGKFGSNTALGWFLVADAFRYSNNIAKVSNSGYTYYSTDGWNPEVLQSNKAHMVMINDISDKRIIIGFEDVNREFSTCDNDFNDCLFYIHLNSHGGSLINNIPAINDKDNDGINDFDDDYPNDLLRAFNNYTHGTLAYEDLWPASGDYDMNDLVMGYNFNLVTNATNKVVEMKSDFNIMAAGASYDNGFGYQYTISPDKIISVTSNNNLVRGGDEVHNSSNGTEYKVKDKATIIVFSHTQKVINYSKYFNTDMSLPKLPYGQLSLLVTFKPNSLLISDLGVPPYNPFIFINKDRSKEVHLPDNLPTSAANLSYLKTQSDNSDIMRGIYYKNKNNMPFALHLYNQSWQYPVEKAHVTDAYTKFYPWASSNGIHYSDWYINNTYKNSSLIYTK